MLHPAIVVDLLDMEAAVARERLGHRISSLEIAGTDVMCTFQNQHGLDVRIRLDGSHYDSHPFGVAVVDEHGNVAPHEAWPGSMSLGMHPILQRPFCCVRGTSEYHVHPSHHHESWDTLRGHLHMADLLDHVLRKAGA